MPTRHSFRSNLVNVWDHSATEDRALGDDEFGTTVESQALHRIGCLMQLGFTLASPYALPVCQWVLHRGSKG